MHVLINKPWETINKNVKWNEVPIACPHLKIGFRVKEKCFGSCLELKVNDMRPSRVHPSEIRFM